MSKPNAVESAEKVVAELEGKRAACIARGTELQDERAHIALKAHTGDGKARARLDELNVEIATQVSELAGIDAALAAAGAQLDQARRDRAARADERNRRALGALLDDYVDNWRADLDRMRLLKEGVQARRALLLEIHALQRAPGMPPYPSIEQDKVFGSLAWRDLASELYQHLMERLDSGERRSVAAWPDNIAAAAARLQEKRTEAA
jgi:hypothetical protein